MADDATRERLTDLLNRADAGLKQAPDGRAKEAAAATVLAAGSVEKAYADQPNHGHISFTVRGLRESVEVWPVRPRRP
jgi:hypothetical protein